MGSSSDEDGVFLRGSPLPDTIGDAKVGGLRQRRRKPLGQLQEKPVAEAFKKLDFHPKAERTATRRASTGGVVSIVCYVIILMLVVSETAEYLRSDTADELRVDTRRADGRMKVALD
ncbi:MAG: hypothetical protein Q8P67_10830, partial [archaeon]|nr:hypothetical protein [archaeon]